MRIILQSQDRFDEIAVLDLDSGRISVYSKTDYPDPVSAFHMINSAVSEEDFDIFLFIHNVINDRQRRNRVFRQEDEPK